MPPIYATKYALVPVASELYSTGTDYHYRAWFLFGLRVAVKSVNLLNGVAV